MTLVKMFFRVAFKFIQNVRLTVNGSLPCLNIKEGVKREPVRMSLKVACPVVAEAPVIFRLFVFNLIYV